MKSHALRRILSATALTAALLAAPVPARAGSCATDYVVCLTDIGGYISSDALHELECWGDYIDCIATLIMLM